MHMTPLSQRDSKWANIKLGTSSVTIGTHGCTITCLAMLAGTTPDIINSRLINVGGYADENLVVWDKIKEALPDMYVDKIGWSYNNADVLANVPCLVEVDGAPIGAYRHWVVYIGNKKLLDPWTGKQESTSKYTPVSYRIIKGEFKEQLVNSWKDYFKLDITKRLPTEVFKGLNLDKAVNFPTETSLDAFYKVWNDANEVMEKAVKSSGEFESKYNIEVQEHDKTKTSFTDGLKKAQDVYAELLKTMAELFGVTEKDFIEMYNAKSLPNVKQTQDALKISNEKVTRLLDQDFTLLESINFVIKSLHGKS